MDFCGDVGMYCNDCGFCDQSKRRPTRDVAREAIRSFLREEFETEAPPSFCMIPNGDEDSAPNKCGWAFWILDDDTTSYIGEDLKIQWLGSSFEVDNV